MGEVKKAVAYLHKACTAQTGGFSGFDQLEAINRYAKAYDIEVIGVYKDAGIERHDLNTMLVIDAPTGEFDYVIVDRLTRFGRDYAMILDTIWKLRDFGIVVISIAEGIDTSSSSGMMLLSVLSAIEDMKYGR